MHPQVDISKIDKQDYGFAGILWDLQKFFGDQASYRKWLVVFSTKYPNHVI
jgi:hypothetical protein